MRPLSLVLIAALFIAAGAAHFAWPDPFLRIVPPFLPFPLALVYISGGAEIVGGACLLVPALRRWAGSWLIALLVAVFPANVYMVVGPEEASLGVDPVWLWLRLPLQLILIAWVWWAARVGGRPAADGG
ncbi:MAG: DoxX family protein [Gemmatimonadota bacterium]